ncbi:MAG: hypothetical protein R3Y32_00275 [Bacillota bacterium]
MQYCESGNIIEVCTDDCHPGELDTINRLVDTNSNNDEIMLLGYLDTMCSDCLGAGSTDCPDCSGYGYTMDSDYTRVTGGVVSYYYNEYWFWACSTCGGSGSTYFKITNSYAYYSNSNYIAFMEDNAGSGTLDCESCVDGMISSPEICIISESISSQVIKEGDNTAVSVVAEVQYSAETAEVSYQWHMATYEDFVPSTATAISGATSNGYNLSQLSVGTYYFKAVVSSTGLSDVTSSAIGVTVEAAPINLGINEDLQDVTIIEGSNTVFKVEAEAIYSDGTTSVGELSYQWYKNGSVIEGETENVLVIGEDEAVGTVLIYVIISADGFDDLKSSNVVLTVLPAVTDFYISQDIQSVAIIQGESTVFAVSAERKYSDGTISTSDISYQWYKNNVQITGATDSSITVGSDLSSGTYTYYVKVSTDGFSDINSTVATLTVNAAATDISITKDIESQSIVEGENAKFSVSAEVGYSNGTTSSSGITYQWYRNGVAISGETGSTLSIGENLDSGEYLIYVQASYEGFTVTSSKVTLLVAAKTYIEVTSAFSDATITEYASKTLQVIAAGVDSDGNAYNYPITYQWYIDGEEIENATSNTYSFKGDMKTITDENGEEEKVSPSEYFVEVKLSCFDCADVYVSGTITVEATEAVLIVCNTCLGAGEIPCQNDCGDSHGIACVFCDGSGYDNSLYYQAPCTLCGNDGFIQCYLCEGDGMMDCPDCGPEAPAVNNNVKEEDPDAWYVEAIKELFLSVTIYVAGVIDLLIGLFEKLVGLENVNIGGESSNLLIYFLDDDATRAVLVGTMCIGFALLFLFTIIGFIRAMQVSDEKVNASSVFEKFITSAVNIILVPTLLVVLIFCTNVIMGQINMALEQGLVYSTEDANDNMEISYGGQMLMLLAENEYDKAKIFDMTVDGVRWSEVAQNLYFKDESTVDMFFPDGQISRSAIFGSDSILYSQGQTFPNYAYMDIENWTDTDGIYYIPTSRLNVFIAFAGCIAMLVSLILCSFTFVKRIFDVMLLYILSPLMISTQPLDDGTRFKQWRDLMISKVISAYAIVLTVNLYFMIVPKIIINPGVIFDTNNSVANGIIQLLFVIGGAFALNGANLVFSQLLGTGNMEHQQNVGSQMALMNMAKVGAGVAIGTGVYAARTVATTAKHGAGLTVGGISGAVQGGTSGGFKGIVSNFGKGAGGYVSSSVGSSRFGETMKDWINKTQGGSGSAGKP